MALQIANSDVVRKVELLARTIGVSKTSAVEEAVDLMLTSIATPKNDRLDSIILQMDAIPDLSIPIDPLAWDDFGLPE